MSLSIGYSPPWILVEPETRRVLEEIVEERRQQELRWGHRKYPQGHPNLLWDQLKLDKAREETNRVERQGTLTWRPILQERFLAAMAAKPGAEFRAQLVQLVGEAVAVIEQIDEEGGS